jgi:hypothetical protein
MESPPTTRKDSAPLRNPPGGFAPCTPSKGEAFAIHLFKA